MALARVLQKKAKKGALFEVNNELTGLLIIAVRNFQKLFDRSFVSAVELIFILKLD